MKKLYLTSLMLVCCTAVMANETKTTTTNSAAATAAKAPVNANTVRVITRPEIVGLWGMEILNIGVTTIALSKAVRNGSVASIPISRQKIRPAVYLP